MKRAFLLLFLLLAATLASGEPQEQRYVDMKGIVQVYIRNIAKPDFSRQVRFSDISVACPLGDYSAEEIIDGERYNIFPMQFKLENKKNILSCKAKVQTDEMEKAWKVFIKNGYHYMLLIDGLLVVTPIGERDASGTPKIYTHRTFSIGVHDNRIISIEPKADRPVDISLGEEYVFSFSVEVFDSPDTARYSIFNGRKLREARLRFTTVMTTILVTSTIFIASATILFRSLRQERKKQQEETKMRVQGLDFIDDHGWIQLYDDVFRIPEYPIFLCSVTGVGAQLAVTFFIAIILNIVGRADITLNNVAGYYAFTSFVSGFISTWCFSFFCSIRPKLASYTRKCLFVTCTIFPLACIIISVVTYAVSLATGAEQMELMTLVYLVAQWIIICIPLSLVGMVFNRYTQKRGERRRFVPHVNQVPRCIPPQKSSLISAVLSVAGMAILPILTSFSAISTYVFAGTVYRSGKIGPILLTAMISFCINIACCSVVGTFFTLLQENHRWQWRAAGRGFACAFFIFCYIVYLLIFRIPFQSVGIFMVFIIVGAVLGIVLGLIGASISYLSSFTFVYIIYSRVKNQ